MCKKVISLTHAHTHIPLKAVCLPPLTWESMWIRRPSLKALRTEDVHGVVQTRPLLKQNIQLLQQGGDGLPRGPYIW